MKTRILAIALLLGFSFAVTAASAQKTPGDHMRRHEVRKSFRKGDLTGPEVGHLARHQHRIHRAQRHARRDGYVGPVERRHIHHMKAKQRRHYYVMKHNSRRRYS